MANRSVPVWDECVVDGCHRKASDEETPFCPDHLPVRQFVTADQLAMAKSVLKRGAGLTQAAARAKADPRDLDAALWASLGSRGQPEAMF